METAKFVVTYKLCQQAELVIRALNWYGRIEENIYLSSISLVLTSNIDGFIYLDWVCGSVDQWEHSCSTQCDVSQL